MYTRTKTLLMPSFQFFRDWYIKMKNRFITLTVRMLKYNTGASSIRVTVAY